MKFYAFVLVVLAACSFNEVFGQSPSTGTLTGPNDPVIPVINFLQQLQRLRVLYANVNPQSILNARTSDPLSLTLDIPAQSGPLSSFGQARNTPLSSSSLGNGLLDIIPDSIGNNPAPAPTVAPTTTLNTANRQNRFGFPFPQFGSTRRTPGPTQRLNSALSEILQGVRSANLERILRGSLQVTGNGGVRSIGDNVISNIFTRSSRRPAAATN